MRLLPSGVIIKVKLGVETAFRHHDLHKLCLLGSLSESDTA